AMDQWTVRLPRATDFFIRKTRGKATSAIPDENGENIEIGHFSGLVAERDAMNQAVVESPDNAERLEAATMLIQTGKAKRAIPILQELLTQSREDSSESNKARWALLGLPDAERDAVIQAMLDSPDDARRIAGANLLIDLGKPGRTILVLQEIAARAIPANRQR